MDLLTQRPTYVCKPVRRHWWQRRRWVFVDEATGLHSLLSYPTREAARAAARSCGDDVVALQQLFTRMTRTA